MGILKDILDATKEIAEKVVNTTEYYATNGFSLEYVSEAEANNRLSICKACPKIGKLNRCSECGCFMSFKTKLLFDPFESGFNNQKTITSCPLGKW